MSCRRRRRCTLAKASSRRMSAMRSSARHRRCWCDRRPSRARRTARARASRACWTGGGLSAARCWRRRPR
eukprot:7094713-Prymnesium_polylepis.1